jgi:hypothetical protein
MSMNPDAVVSALSGLGGILVGSGIVGLVIRGKFQAVDTLTRDLTQLKDERVAGIEQRLCSFETGCALKHDRLQETLTRVEHTAADVTNILGWTKKLDGKLDRIAEDAAASRSRVDGQDRWLQNLDNAHQAHVGDRELHNGR